MSIEALNDLAASGATPPPAPSGPTTGDDQSVALDLGATSDNPLESGDGVATLASKSRVPSGVLLLVAVLLMAAGALYVMKLTGTVGDGNASVKAAEKQIDQALAALTGHNTAKRADDDTEPMQTTEQVIARFAQDPAEKQVALDYLSKNPFSMQSHSRTDTVSSDAEQGASVTDMGAQLRAKKLRDELSRYELQTVMNGRIPLAMVNGQVVREGDKLGSFRVAAIEKMSIVLDAEGNTYRVSMDQPHLGK